MMIICSYSRVTEPKACSVGLRSSAWKDELHFIGESKNMWVVSTGFRVASSYLERVIEFLHRSTGASFYLVCLAGHENADEVEYCFSDMEQYYEKLIETVRDAYEANGGPVNVIGHSLAGLIFIRIAAEYPQYIKRMVLFAPAVGLGSPVYLLLLWLIRNVHRLVGGDRTVFGKVLRFWQITPPYEWDNPLLRVFGRLLVAVRMMPPYVWETSSRGGDFHLFTFADWMLRGDRTRLGRSLRRLQATPSHLQHWRFLRILARALVEWRLIPHPDWTPPHENNEFRFFRMWIEFLRGYWPTGLHSLIRFQRRKSSSWRYEIMRRFHGFLVEKRILPPSDWIHNREVCAVETLQFPRVPLVSASSIPPFQREALKGLGKIACPVLILHGTHDTVVPYNDAVWLHKSLLKLKVQSELIAIPGGGHSFMLTSRHYHFTVESVISWWRDGE